MATNTTAGNSTNRQKIRQCLRDFNFKALFVEELGWDILNEHPLIISVDSTSYILRSLVEKLGVRVFVCEPDAEGRIPADGVLRKIEHEVIRYAYEHFIIYVDAAGEQQVWQWVKREQGKRLASRMHRYHRGQSGELLAQKLERLAIGLEEEERLQMTEVAGRVAKAFDVERVTKKFYDRFKREHAAFLNLIGGIEAQADREWYASLMLNRLMFIYFIQRKGFLDTKAPGSLDGDPNYLSNRLSLVQQERGEDQFHPFYRYFLLKLFHEGLSQRMHAPELEALLGSVPYLNGGLFDVHALERANPEITIPDEAFEQLFSFLDEFDWYLDDRPLRSDREINPDVLGYIFEKYINQKQMGAYYTKEDITEYISKNTILPFLLEAAEQQCQIAFRPDGPVWSVLCENPDAYIYDAVKKGCNVPLPPEIEVGLNDVVQRSEWNKPAPEAYALPTETWREVVARRTRYQYVWAKLAAGEITSANDLITLNLDSRRFAEDVITYCKGTDLLRALYDSIEQVTVLDPTCGSGAFLFSALGILEGLYEASLERMQDMVEEREALDAVMLPEKGHSSLDIAHFRAILERVKQHPSPSYFIYKSIIVNNLYGVDIMEEATEVCKLRLFLKLVSQVERFDDIEPLPDIDFNIRAGNTLIGFASYEETKQAIEGKTLGKAIQNQMIFDDRLERIEQKAQNIERTFEQFHALQTTLEPNPADMTMRKQQLQQMLGTLRAELNGYLASEYAIDRNSIPNSEEYDAKFTQWQWNHQPFHWWVEFYGIMKRGGFDVIIGNPPYVDYSKVKMDYTVKGYQTERCGNLYAFTAERCLHLMNQKKRIGLVVMLNLTFAEGFRTLRHELWKRTSDIWVSLYDNIPDGLFAGSSKTESQNTNKVVSQRVCIVLGDVVDYLQPRLHSSAFLRWNRNYRPHVFSSLTYGTRFLPKEAIWPALGSSTAVSIYTKLQKIEGVRIAQLAANGGPEFLQLGATPRYFISAVPEQLNRSGLIEIRFRDSQTRKAVECILNSILFYWYWRATGDGFHMTKSTIFDFPVPYSLLSDSEGLSMMALSLEAVREQCRTSKLNNGIMVYNVNYNLSPRTLVGIEQFLRQHYALSDEEADFLTNYETKYRLFGDSSIVESI